MQSNKTLLATPLVPAAHARGVAPVMFEPVGVPGTSFRRRLVIPTGGGDGKVNDHAEEGENKDKEVT